MRILLLAIACVVGLSGCNGESILDDNYKKPDSVGEQNAPPAPIKDGILFSIDRIKTNGKPNVEQVVFALDEQLVDRKTEEPLSAAQLASLTFELTGAQADLFKLEKRTIKSHKSNANLDDIKDGEHTVLVFNPQIAFFYDEVQGRCDARNCLVTVKATTRDGKQAVTRVQFKLLDQDKFVINKALPSLTGNFGENFKYEVEHIVMLAKASDLETSKAGNPSNHYFLPMYEIMKGVKPLRNEEGEIPSGSETAFFENSALSPTELLQLKYELFDDNTAIEGDDSGLFSIVNYPFDAWADAMEMTKLLTLSSGPYSVLVNGYARHNVNNIHKKLAGSKVPVLAFKSPTVEELRRSGRYKSNIALKEGINEARSCNIFNVQGNEIKFYGPYGVGMLITSTNPDNLPVRLNLKIYVIDDLLPLGVKTFKFDKKILSSTTACWPYDYGSYLRQDKVKIRYPSLEQLQDAIKWSDETFGNVR